MKRQSLIFAVVMFAIGNASSLAAQTEEIKLDATQAKITTVSAMRARKAPQTTAEEIVRLKLGTVVNAIARSTNQDAIGGKTDYWYRVNLPNSQTGWLFGGLLLDYSASKRQERVRQIIEARLKAENTDFSDRQEIYNLATSSANEAKDASTRAEFELLKVLALANSALSLPYETKVSPYREWVKEHAAEVVYNEFAGGYQLRADVLWNLEKKYHALPIADRIAWEAAQMWPPSDCEGDEVCAFFLSEGDIKYLSVYPAGAHAPEALKGITEALTDQVITFANEKGGDKYAVEQRADLKKLLTSLRLAAAKTSAPEKTEIVRKLERIN
ncbi:MAG TPA: SH3 domain-containing protein [Pyrinomonadaceae bacterium]|nr:SH3 domain-containing protein [Pyrinomonadaceae bacterium]